MATLSDTGFPTIANVARRLKPNGGVETDIAEVLNQELDILDDIPWVAGNLPTGDLVTSRTGLPTPEWRQLNGGVGVGKSDTDQYTETCGMLEKFSKVDVDMALLHGNSAAYRMTEDKAVLEGFAQEVARSLFYESAVTNPTRVHGLAARYPGTSGYTSSSYVLKPGTNSGSNCQSIWLISWDPDKICGIFPKDSVAGLHMEDVGRQLTKDSGGTKEFMALVSRFQWKLGFRVKDYRYAVRFQYDPDDSAGGFGTTGSGLVDGLYDMLEVVQKVVPGATFYMSRTAKRLFNAQMSRKTSNLLEYIERGGKRIQALEGVAIRRTDALVAESAIS
jgi:hypothetical protein